MTAGLVVRSVQKAGNDPDENEDRGASLVDGRITRLAVADGATEASFSDLWAQVLVDSAVRVPPRDVATPSWLEAALDAWSERVPPSDQLPWYAQAKLAEGSHAALASVELRAGASRYAWRARVIGDCEVFLLKPHIPRPLVRAFPLTISQQFGFHPALVPTNRGQWPALAPLDASGRVRPPFELWLVTDALAQACLLETEQGGDPWSAWAEASRDGPAFRAMVDEKLATRSMRNDDVTMVRLWVR